MGKKGRKTDPRGVVLVAGGGELSAVPVGGGGGDLVPMLMVAAAAQDLRDRGLPSGPEDAARELERRFPGCCPPAVE
jgi:hypothetical protein